MGLKPVFRLFYPSSSRSCKFFFIMHKSTKFIGIDISKKIFDVWSDDFGHKQFKNAPDGFHEFLLLLNSNSWCIMVDIPEHTDPLRLILGLVLFCYQSNVK